MGGLLDRHAWSTAAHRSKSWASTWPPGQPTDLDWSVETFDFLAEPIIGCYGDIEQPGDGAAYQNLVSAGQRSNSCGPVDLGPGRGTVNVADVGCGMPIRTLGANP